MNCRFFACPGLMIMNFTFNRMEIFRIDNTFNPFLGPLLAARAIRFICCAGYHCYR
jgi:hypothetical protein